VGEEFENLEPSSPPSALSSLDLERRDSPVSPPDLSRDSVSSDAGGTIIRHHDRQGSLATYRPSPADDRYLSSNVYPDRHTALVHYNQTWALIHPHLVAHRTLRYPIPVTTRPLITNPDALAAINRRWGPPPAPVYNPLRADQFRLPLPPYQRPQNVAGNEPPDLTDNLP
jgi:hypothetical protein